MMLGRHSLRQLVAAKSSIADPLADAAEAMSREGVGALIVIQREVSLAPYIDTGERIEAKLTTSLIRTIFVPKSPLHDGAVILVKGKVIAAGCQLPMRSHERIAESSSCLHLGMRHRAALSISEETDAIVVVVSEETGRISLAMSGRFETVARELPRRLVDMLTRRAAQTRLSGDGRTRGPDACQCEEWLDALSLSASRVGVGGRDLPSICCGCTYTIGRVRSIAWRAGAQFNPASHQRDQFHLEMAESRSVQASSPGGPLRAFARDFAVSC